MGKYEDDEDGSIDIDFRDKVLIAIANELAEANRLKRLELNDTCSATDEELEDKV